MTEEETTAASIEERGRLERIPKSDGGLRAPRAADAGSPSRAPDLEALGCARCHDRAEATALVGTQAGSFRIDLCIPHLEEVLVGARPIR